MSTGRASNDPRLLRRQQQAEAARVQYEQTKNAARKVADSATHSAANAFRDAGNAIAKLGKKKKKHKKGPDPLFAASVFDWDYYYDAHPDVVQINMDMATHWKDYGFYQGRAGSFEFDPVFYWNKYPDLVQICGAGNLHCGIQHWLSNGIGEGRVGSPNFSVVNYLNKYPDLLQAYGQYGFGDALHHWITVGKEEGRSPL